MRQTTRRSKNGKATLLDRLEQSGLTPGVPDSSGDDTFRAVGIDCACWASETCPACGRLGLAVLPLQAGPRYGLLCVCPDCGHQAEG